MKKSKKKIFYDILVVFFAAVLVFSLYKIADYYLQNKKSTDFNTSVANEFVTYEENEEPLPENSSSTKEDEVSYYHAKIPASVNFDKLMNKSKDIVGWLFNQNGVINYPIVQAEDNDYYLDRLIDGTKNANGSIFMESVNKSDFSDRNTIIYGHSMKNGTMFGTLLRYRYQYYYNEYPEFYIYTPSKNYRVDVFAAYETNTEDKVYSLMNSSSEFNEFLTYAFSKSKITTGVSVGADDKIITFSTCAYSDENSRFIVCGKLVELNT